MEDFIVEIQGSKYHDAVIFDEYTGDFSLIAGYIKQDGETIKKWGYPKLRTGPAEKAIPTKVLIGCSIDEAIKTLRMLLEYAESMACNAPKKDSSDEQYKLMPETDDDIPF